MFPLFGFSCRCKSGWQLRKYRVETRYTIDLPHSWPWVKALKLNRVTTPKSLLPPLSATKTSDLEIALTLVTSLLTSTV